MIFGIQGRKFEVGGKMGCHRDRLGQWWGGEEEGRGGRGQGGRGEGGRAGGEVGLAVIPLFMGVES